MTTKAFCYRDGTISISNDVPAVGKAFLRGKRFELNQFLNLVAKKSFYGVLSVPNFTGHNLDRDYETLEKFADQIKLTLRVFQAGNKFLSLEVLL